MTADWIRGMQATCTKHVYMPRSAVDNTNTRCGNYYRDSWKCDESGKVLGKPDSNCMDNANWANHGAKDFPKVGDPKGIRGILEEYVKNPALRGSTHT